MPARIQVLLYLLASSSSLPAATLIVDLRGGGDYTEIQPAIDAAEDGDTVLVKPGEYVISESIAFLGKAITVKAQNGAAETMIRVADPPADVDPARAVVFEDEETLEAVLDGFTICSGRFGVVCSGTSPTIQSCTITRNAIGVVCWGSPVIVNCTIAQNESYGVWCAGMTASPSLMNCTVAMPMYLGLSVRCSNDASLRLTNCIIRGGFEFKSTGALLATYSCIPGLPPGEGNISGDPLFCGWSPGGEIFVDAARNGPGEGSRERPYRDLVEAMSDFRFSLTEDSPCRGTGAGGANMGADNGVCAGPPLDAVIIHLAPGDYQSLPRSFMGLGISIQGAGEDETRIWSEPLTPVSTFGGLRPGAFFADLTIDLIRTGSEHCVALNLGAGEVRNCTIKGGWGERCFGGNVRITNCNIVGGSQPHFDGNASITNCNIMGFSLVDCQGDAQFTNCTFTHNGVPYIENSVTCGGNVTFANCTIAGNSGGVLCQEGSSPTFTSCIFWDNWDNAGTSIEISGDAEPTVTYSCVEGEVVWPGEGNINADPLFCGWSPGADIYVDPSRTGHGDGSLEHPFSNLDGALASFSLSRPPNSPCLGAGAGGADMGADNGTCDGPPVLAATLHLAPGEYWSTLAATLSRHASIQGAGKEETAISHGVSGLRTGAFLRDLELWYVTVGGGEAPEIRDCRIGSVSCSDKASPSVANCTIDGELDQIYSAIVSAVSCSDDSSPRFTRCRITRGWGGVVCGGNASPIFTECAITDNWDFDNDGFFTGKGGGVSCGASASPHLVNCIISRNFSFSIGGGVSCRGNSSPRLTNCIISGNYTDDRGGGVLCLDNASPSFTNCTIAENSAREDIGGGVYAGSNASPAFTNCILYSNNGEDPIHVEEDATPAVTYSCVESDEPWPGEGNIKGDPLFFQPGVLEGCDPAIDAPCLRQRGNRWVFDYHLQPGSACTDAGTPEGAPPTDIEGNVRPCGRGVDMGAYERGGCGPAPRFMRGDPDGTGGTDVTDSLFILDYLFLGGPVPSCLDAADSDDNGALEITDAVYLLMLLFLEGPPPEEPFAECGADTTADRLNCVSFAACD